MNYDFPVALEKTFTKTGVEIPGRRAVVRKDTDTPIASVGLSYKLTEHKTIMDKAKSYADIFGSPVTSFTVNPKGDRVLAEFTFKEITQEVAKGDLVGLRFYIDSSYNAKSSNKLRIGGLRLACLNGMVSPTSDVYSISARHTGENTAIVFPEKELLLSNFERTVKDLARLTTIEYTTVDYQKKLIEAVDNNIISEAAINNIKDNERTAWDMYNRFTNHITHNESAKASYINKINRLSKVAKWFDAIA